MASKKVSKESVHYQAQPKGAKRCARCTMWEPPNTCTHVRGHIFASGYCNDFEQKEVAK